MKKAYEQIYNNTWKEGNMPSFQVYQQEKDKYAQNRYMPMNENSRQRTTVKRSQQRNGSFGYAGSAPKIFNPPELKSEQVKISPSNQISFESNDRAKSGLLKMKTPFTPMLEGQDSAVKENDSEFKKIKTTDESQLFDHSVPNFEESSYTEESSSEGNDYLQQNDTDMVGEFASMLSKDAESDEQINDFPSILDESDSLQDETFLILAESSSQIEMSYHAEEGSNDENYDYQHIASMLEEPSSDNDIINIEEKISFLDEDGYSLYTEESFLENPFNSDESGNLSSYHQEYSAMLEESSQVYTGHQKKLAGTVQSEDEYSDSSPFEGELTSLLKKAYSILDGGKNKFPLQTEFISLIGDSSSLKDEFLSILDETNTGTDTEETTETYLQIDSEDQSDLHSMRLNKISSLLRKFSELMNNTEPEDDLDLKDSEDFYPNDADLFLTDEESSFYQESQAYIQDKNILESDDFTEKYDIGEEKKGCIEHTCLPNIHLPTVKLPVLLARLEIDIDIFDAFPLNLPIENISNLEWSITSLDCKVPLPSSVAFLKGELLADIEYVNSDDKKPVRTIKVPIIWEKSANIEWDSTPVMPSLSIKREITFNSPHTEEIESHFEQTQHFSEQIKSQIQSINFVWHEEFSKEQNGQKIQIQGTAKLKIDLMQDQYVDLNRF